MFRICVQQKADSRLCRTSNRQNIVAFVKIVLFVRLLTLCVWESDCGSSLGINHIDTSRDGTEYCSAKDCHGVRGNPATGNRRDTCRGLGLPRQPPPPPGGKRDDYHPTQSFTILTTTTTDGKNETFRFEDFTKIDNRAIKKGYIMI